MNLFVYNLLLAVIWTFLTGNVTAGSLGLGFMLGYLALAALQRATVGAGTYFTRTRRFVAFLFFFIHELVVSTLKVAYDVLTPTHHMEPGIIGVPLDAESDLEITLLANLISLTPGTLSLDVAPDRKILYIHAMYVDDPDRVRRQIKEGLERRLLDLLR